MLKFKNIIFILIVIALSSMIIPTSASAASTTTFYVDNVSAKPGDNITIPVMIKNNKGFVSTSLCIEYDSSVLTLLGVEDKNLIAGALHTTNFVSPYFLSWENDTKTSNYTVNGTLVELSFAVSIFAEPGEYSITVNSPLDGVLDCNGDDVDCYFTNGKLTVLSPECDHSWSAWKKSNSSRHKRSCNCCGEIETELHDWEEGVITIEPGPGVGGEMTYTCETCRYQNVEIIDPEPDSHEHNFIKSSVVSPTCTQEGYTLYVCDDCSAIKKENITASLGHSYTSSVVAPTCSSSGYTLNTCSRCNDQTKSDYVPAVDHKYQNGKCVYCGIEDPSADSLCDLALIDCYSWFQIDPSTGNITTEFNIGVKNLGEKASGTYTVTVRVNSPTGEIIYQCSHDDVYIGEQQNFWGGNRGITDTVVYYISVEYDYDTDRSNNYTLLVTTPHVDDINMHSHYYEQFVNNGESGHKSICVNQCGEYLIHPHWYAFDDATECVICGHSKNHTHSFSVWSNHSTTQHKRTCSCGEVEYADHIWNDGVITKEPTSTANGIKTFTCTVCNATRTEEIISDNIAVTGIALSNEAISMKIGESFLLQATVLPGNATNQTIIWSCDNSSVIQINKAISNTAYVDLVALSSGVATITARTEDGNFIAICKVTVTEEHKHTLVHVPYKAPTATEDGNVEYWYCKDCGYAWLDEACTINTNLKSVVIPATGVQESQGLEFTLNEDKASYSLSGIGSCKDTDIVIPATYNGLPVTAIADYAFHPYPYSPNITITSVIVPEGVTTIGSNAFRECWALKKIVLSKTVTSFGSYPFNDCVALTELIVEDGNNTLVSIDNCIIDRATKTLILGCGGSKIPNDGSVTAIGSYAFISNGLKSIVIPDAITSIGFGAFEGCENLENIHIGSGVTSINNRAFQNSNGYIKSFTVSEDNKVYKAINNCLIQKSNKMLIAAFSGFILPTDGSIEKIGYRAFEALPDVTSIVIPEGVTSIGESAFTTCNNLTTITFPSTVTTFTRCPLLRCNALTTVKFHEDNTKFAVINNCIINKSTKTLIAAFGDFEIPSDGSVTTIGMYAFQFHDNLTSIQLPNGIKTISSYAFYRTTNLKTIILPNTISTINGYAFQDCSRLRTLEFNGTEEEWASVDKKSNWDSIGKSGNLTVVFHSHSFSAWTPGENDSHKRTCSCGAIETGTHNWNTGIITTPPTYTTGGVMTYTCSECKERKLEFIPTKSILDINTDGEVDEIDAETILKYITGHDVEVDKTIIDVNGDGKINIRDAAIVLLYLNNK